MSEAKTEMNTTPADRSPSVRTWSGIVALLIGAVIYQQTRIDKLTDDRLQSERDKGELRAEVSKIREDYANRLENLYEQRRQLVAYSNRFGIDSSFYFDSPANNPDRRSNQP